MAAPGWPERFAVVDEMLLRLLAARAARAARRSPPPRSAGPGGSCSPRAARSASADLAEQTGWSARHLTGRFRTEIGLDAEGGRAGRPLHPGPRAAAAARAAGEPLAWPAWRARVLRPGPPGPGVPVAGGLPPSLWIAEEFRNIQATARWPLREWATMNDDRSPPPQVWPSLRARDARALIRFLTEAFGFEETVGLRRRRAGRPRPAVLAGGRRDHARLRSATGRPARPTPGAFGAYVVTDRPDALCERARAAGAEITAEPYDTDYGSRDFAARDPEGNRWTFGTYRGEPRKGLTPSRPAAPAGLSQPAGQAGQGRE